MCSRLAQVVVLAGALLLVGRYVCAQSSPEIQTRIACPSSADASDKQSSDPEISIGGVTFSGFLQMPVPDQEEIAASIKEQTYRASLDQATDEWLEIARNGWQNRGYIKVKANGYATTLDSTPAVRRIALNIHVDEGLRYSLGGITFTHNQAVSNVEALRPLFPLKDGDIFSKEKIGIGLGNLRKAYGELGYLNFTSIPNTTFDDEKKLIHVNIDVNEGKQFYVDDINITGLDDAARQKALRDMPIRRGQIYNVRLWDMSWRILGARVPSCNCGDSQPFVPDESRGTVTLTFDLRPCAAQQNLPLSH